MLTADLEAKLSSLQAQGVVVIDPRQTYLDEFVKLDRICAGAVLYPGTRLIGARTFVGPRARIGSEGPTVLDNTIVGENSEIASGFLREAVLLRNSRVGSNAHIRSGTLLEEEASVAHAVGLKHTILMSFVTMGSLINFCDGLISGGTSRRDHSEIGSGFIHFNFTPWGQSGDKATPSMIGDVVRGVFLRERRVFLGGLSGLVGPQTVGFGSFTVAGQVIRSQVPPSRIFSELPRQVDKEFSFGRLDLPDRRLKLNLMYIGQLYALRAWYQQVRLRRIPEGTEFSHHRIVVEEAARLIGVCIDERVKRLKEFTEERGALFTAVSATVSPCPLPISAKLPYVDHVDWVKSLSDTDTQQGISWLQSVADSVGAGDSR